MENFELRAYSVSIGEFDTALNFGDFGARFSISEPTAIVISDDDGLIDETTLATTNVTIGDDDQGQIIGITYRTIEVGSESFEVAILERSAVADYLIVPINVSSFVVSDSPLPVSSGYSVGDEFELPEPLSIDASSSSNAPPVGVDDVYDVSEDGSLSVASNGVLSNDTDADGDGLTVSLLSDVSNGTLALNGDGSFDYTPDADFNGTDSFSYTVSDGNGGTDTATVEITVNPVNDDPVAVDDLAVTSEDEAVVIDVLANDDDVDGDTLSVSSVGQGANGTVAITPEGTVSYTPDADFNGTDSFSYEISDGNGGTSSATVEIRVNSSEVILGTEGNDRLIGTDGNDIIDPLGGSRDLLFGRDGADVFDFSSSSSNGVSERKIIKDFDATEGDLINLGDAEIASFNIRNNGDLVVKLDPDNDILVLENVSVFDPDFFL